MLSGWPVCIVLLLAAAVAVNAANSAFAMPPFSGWMAQQTSSKAKKTASGYYEELETERVCMRASRLTNCLPLKEDLSAIYYEAIVGCCPHRAALNVSWPEPNTRCSWELYGFLPDYWITYPDNPLLSKLGFFHLTCTMGDGADECGAPLSSGLTLTGTGDFYLYDEVAFVGLQSWVQPFVNTTVDPRCELLITPLSPSAREGSSSLFNEATPAKPQASATAPDKPTPAEAPANKPAPIQPDASKAAPAKPAPPKAVPKNPAKVQYGREEQEGLPLGEKFYTGGGFIFTGTFTSVSTHYATKAKSGLWQLVAPAYKFSEDVYPVSDRPGEKAYVANGFEFDLTFINNGGYDKQ